MTQHLATLKKDMRRQQEELEGLKNRMKSKQKGKGECAMSRAVGILR